MKLKGKPMNDRADELLKGHRSRVSILALTVLLLSALLISCINKEVSEVGGTRSRDPAGGADYLLAGYEVENPHFEIANVVGPVPAYTYWLKKGDAVTPAFDTFELHWQRESKLCGFLDNTPFSADGADCAVCDYCTDGNAASCLGVVFGGGGGIFPGFLEVISFPGFLPGDFENVYSFAEYNGVHKVIAACPNQSQSRLPFVPDKTGLYRLVSDAGIAFRGGTEGTVKLFIVDDANPSPTTTYRLTSHSEGEQLPDPCATPAPSPSPSPTPSNCPGCVWFKLPKPSTMGAFREESFSPNLHITKIRVLKGTPSSDPITGRFKLDAMTATPVHPSRIVLFPASSDGQSVLDNEGNRCYANSSADGDINLATCRRDFNVDCSGPNCLLDATPQYMQSMTSEGLIWFAEFNPAQGGIIPTLSCGEVLAIEFTLERS
jgi:hypothetical protein